MRIAIVTDAWEPQINGVVNTLKATQQYLRSSGHQVLMVSSQNLHTFACPTYPEIRLAYKPYNEVAAQLAAFDPERIHIATEGPMGLAARRYCLRQGLNFTTAYHTRFPEYLHARMLLPKAVTYRWLKWFHGPSKAVMVPTPRIRDMLAAHGFPNPVLWSRGVNTDHFRPPTDELNLSGIERPLFLYVGRLAVEKNIEAFLKIDLPGTKWVIGDGPLKDLLQTKYPDAYFLGAKPHADLPSYYQCADVVVFPSQTDTFGLVLIEAMACGVPVAAYPAEGPIDVVAQGVSGILDTDLAQACSAALNLNRDGVRKHALRYSWEIATEQFVQNLTAVRSNGGQNAGTHVSRMAEWINRIKHRAFSGTFSGIMRLLSRIRSMRKLALKSWQ
jgi:glycosyltransferase involved in cell wall biosynthesis